MFEPSPKGMHKCSVKPNMYVSYHGLVFFIPNFFYNENGMNYETYHRRVLPQGMFNKYMGNISYISTHPLVVHSRLSAGQLGT
jgi:hypothetical protein